MARFSDADFLSEQFKGMDKSEIVVSDIHYIPCVEQVGIKEDNLKSIEEPT